MMRDIALKYNLHPLAIEDTLHTTARSKSEYYRHHLFVNMAVHNLVSPPTLDGEAASSSSSDRKKHPGEPPWLSRVLSDLGRTRSRSPSKGSSDQPESQRSQRRVEEGIIDPDVPDSSDEAEDEQDEADRSRKALGAGGSTIDLGHVGSNVDEVRLDRHQSRPCRLTA